MHYIAMKLREHGTKVVERVLEKSLCRIVTINEMQFGFLPDRGTIEAVSMLRSLQEEYHDEGKKLYICLVNQDNAFDRVPRKLLEWVMRKEGKPEVMVRSMVRMYEGANY